MEVYINENPKIHHVSIIVLLYSRLWGGFFATSLFDKLHGFIQGMPIYISSEEAGKATQQQPVLEIAAHT